MGGKVIHIEDKTHKQLKTHTAHLDLCAKDWVEFLIRAALKVKIQDPRRCTILCAKDDSVIGRLKTRVQSLETQLEEEKQRKRPVLVPLIKKPLERLPEADNSNGYEAPPFWSKSADPLDT